MTTSQQLTRVVRFGLINAYLVAEDDGLTLVDTGMGMAPAILAQAEALGAPIKRIALTHAHGDHVGSLDALVERLSDVEVAISARDAKLLSGQKVLEPGETGKLRGSYPGVKTQPTRLLAAGDRVGSLEVVAAPGHTPGHVAFLDTRNGGLLCGDAFSTVGGVATSAKLHWRFPLPYGATWDREIELESAKALRALNPTRLAPGHGKIVENPGAAMDAAIAKAS
jgi:glyoxylase-like metal-dependent hydrolase (beta-lactamase superfamily II)